MVTGVGHDQVCAAQVIGGSLEDASTVSGLGQPPAEVPSRPAKRSVVNPTRLPFYWAGIHNCPTRGPHVDSKYPPVGDPPHSLKS